MGRPETRPGGPGTQLHAEFMDNASMDPIGRRPVALQTPPQPAKTEPRPAANTVQTLSNPQTVGHTQKSGFEAPGVKAAQAPVGTWRAPADSELGKVINGMLERLK